MSTLRLTAHLHLHPLSFAAHMHSLQHAMAPQSLLCTSHPLPLATPLTVLALLGTIGPLSLVMRKLLSPHPPPSPFWRSSTLSQLWRWRVTLLSLHIPPAFVHSFSAYRCGAAVTGCWLCRSRASSRPLTASTTEPYSGTGCNNQGFPKSLMTWPWTASVAVLRMAQDVFTQEICEDIVKRMEGRQYVWQ